VANSSQSSESKIQAEPRTEFGKGAARRIRRADKVPAVLYGHGADPVHITMPGHDTMLALKHGGANALLTITVEGKEQMALPKQIQRDPIKGFLEHLDLIIVRKGEKVTVDIPVHLAGEPTPDALIVTETALVSVEAEATHIPEYIEVSIEGLKVGDQILAKDLQVPSGSTLLTDEETLIVNVTHAPTAEELEEELAEAEAEAGIEREEHEEEPEGAEGAAEGEAADAEGGEAAEGAEASEGE
jgi:large subunit ribosomal protein L25